MFNYFPSQYNGADYTGRKVYNFGGGGGGSAPQPTSTTTTQTTIPEYAQPYMERLLGQAEAAAQTPYQTYGGERLARTTPEQEAARAGIAGLQTPGQFMGGTGFLGAGGLGSLAAGQNYFNMATTPGIQQMFMSPYMQNVVDVQKQEALRDAQKGQLLQNLGAARQGTYGGARQLLAGTERERNLQNQMAQIQATGSQRAFEAAQQAMQFGTTAGLQGAQTAIQAGQGLGQLGTQQQAADLARLQAQETAGALGQRDIQSKLDLGYQDFLAQQRYPYAQLGFMSDILRGSGNLAATGSQAIYQAPPSTGSQLLGLAGTLGGAWLAGGAPKFFAEGGEVRGLGAAKRYAEGGEVIDQMVDVAKLTPEQIQQVQGIKKGGGAAGVSDIILLAALDKKLEDIKRVTAQGGLPTTNAAEDIRAEAAQQMGGGLNSIPIADNYYRSEQEVANMAGGGIVAFANGGSTFDGFMPDDVIPTNVAPPVRGLSSVLDEADTKKQQSIMDQLSLQELQEYNRSGKLPARLSQPKTATAAARAPAPAPKKEMPDVKVSDKTVKKVEKAEDAYEKALKAELDKTDMSDDDKMRAIGFALMKAGAKTMAGKSQYALQNIGEGIEAGADEYVKVLNQAKKDRRELTKTLAEYGLAKERIGVQREQVAATERGAASQEAMRRDIATQNTIAKANAEYNDLIAANPLLGKRFLDKDNQRLNPDYVSRSEFLRQYGVELRGPQTTVQAPGQRMPISQAITPRG